MFMKAPHTVCIIQARMGSSRLPGKVMKNLCGMPVLWHIIERIRSVNNGIDHIVVATSNLNQDKIIVDACHAWKCDVFCGDERNVLQRFIDTANKTNAQRIIRITADCPLIDPALITSMLMDWNGLTQNNVCIDYLSNVLHSRTYPKGLDTEIFTFQSLLKAHLSSPNNYECEHVTPYIYNHPEEFVLKSFQQETDLSNLRWTLDTPQDYIFIAAIYGALYYPEKPFNTQDVLRLIKEIPNLNSINLDS